MRRRRSWQCCGHLVAPTEALQDATCAVSCALSAEHWGHLHARDCTLWMLHAKQTVPIRGVTKSVESKDFEGCRGLCLRARISAAKVCSGEK